jgi:pimeloyl-ACP methyl ester carboxylesterase/DNA-binding CsgD family transcriptional regulator
VESEIRFAESRDGTRIAWSKHGTGPPLVRAGTWLTHLQHDWESDVWRHWLEELGRRFTVIRYDDRGSGLSDRTPPALGLDAWVQDLDAVIAASGAERVSLFGMSQGAAIAVAYAARHPERVARLICLGGYAKGSALRGQSADDREEAQAMLTLMRVGWGRPDPTFRRLFTGSLMPDGSEAQMRAMGDLQRQSATGEMAAKLARARGRVQVTRLASRVTVPSLVLHARDDQNVPFEEGRRLAALIPKARFVPLDGRNHVLLPDEPAWPRFLQALDDFVAQDGAARNGAARTEPAPDRPIPKLTERELEVLRLIGVGRSNADIASDLAISVRTVERHLTNTYAKMGLAGRSARAAAAARRERLAAHGGG